MNASYWLAVGAGGAIGSMMRYAVTMWVVERLGAGFPWHTIAINVVGSFAIGIISVYARSSAAIPPLLSTLVIVGVLGGFTTFSTFSYDTLTLASEGAGGLAFAYCLGSVACGLLAAVAGTMVARHLLHAV